MSVELTMLLWTVALFFVQLAAQIVADWMEHGTAYLLGSRDDYSTPTGIGGRIERAYYNLLESLAPFAALVIVATFTGQVNEWTALGAQIYFWGRVAYFPLYVLAIPFLRTLVWLASMAGLAMILWQLLI